MYKTQEHINFVGCSSQLCFNEGPSFSGAWFLVIQCVLRGKDACSLEPVKGAKNLRFRLGECLLAQPIGLATPVGRPHVK